MKSISIRQPWAWLIVNGFKNIENRTRRTNFRGEILVHASGFRPKEKAWNSFQAAFGTGLFGDFKLPDMDKIDFGGIVGKTEIVDCISKSDSQWFEGPYGYVLKNSKPLSFISCKGQVTIPFEVDIKPKKCGDCIRFYDGSLADEHTFCTPIKEKYGWEPVTADQKPSVNCPYETLYLENMLEYNLQPK
jgi:hypothetical protein